MSIKREKLKIYDMTCTSCEKRIEKAISELEGILNVKASYIGQFVEVEYDDVLCLRKEIEDAIKRAGYSTKEPNDYKFIGFFIIAAAIVLLGLKTSGFDMSSKLNNASYAVLFIVGLFTSIHCVGMCGGIMLSQSLPTENNNRLSTVMPAVLYNFGRVVSYTILGGIVGAIGSVFSLSIITKAIIEILAGVFMIMMGFNMAGFSLFKKFHIRLPFTVCNINNKSESPFLVGFLNGLMPCGPLQTMQIFALGTGNAFKGALSMFIFAVGTVPLMFTFGAVSGILSKGYTKRILKLSGVMVIVLGLIMGNRGLALAGININPMTVLAVNTSNRLGGKNVAKATIQDGIQVINMIADNRGYTPNAFYVQKGIPVRWVIDGKQLNFCNNTIIVQTLNLQWKLKNGENVREFIPGDKDINFSCWMGMIRGIIKVVDNLDSIDISQDDKSVPSPSTGQSCCTGPVSENSQAGAQESIYGSDISKVPTETLVNKAIIEGKLQNAKFIGIGYEFQPLIVVTGSTMKTNITFDFSTFDYKEGEYLIIDADTGNRVISFKVKKGISEVEFNPRKSGSYLIVKDDNVFGAIEVVDDLKNADLQKVREKYIR